MDQFRLVVLQNPEKNQIMFIDLDDNCSIIGNLNYQYVWKKGIFFSIKDILFYYMSYIIVLYFIQKDQLIEQLLSSDVDINDLVNRLAASSTQKVTSELPTPGSSKADTRNQVNFGGVGEPDQVNFMGVQLCWGIFYRILKGKYSLLLAVLPWNLLDPSSLWTLQADDKTP